MKTNMIKVMMGILCSVFLFYVGSVYADILTQGEKVTLDKMINQQVKNKNDRQSARNEWSEARRVAEFLCRPVALKEIQKRYPDADRVFLGSGHNDGLTLHSASRLTGCGQFRTGGGDWSRFNFECQVDPVNGNVLQFRYSADKQVRPYPMAPGPALTTPHTQK